MRLLSIVLTVSLSWGAFGSAQAAIDLTGNSSADGSSGSFTPVTEECKPGRCFSSAQARQTYAKDNSCYFLEDVCDAEGSKGEEQSLLAKARSFAKGVADGLGDQFDEIVALLSGPIEAFNAMVALIDAFIDDPEGTILALASLAGEGINNLIIQATQCGAYDLGKIIGQNVSPVAVLKVGIRLSKFGGKIGDAVRHTKIELGCASFVAGTPVWLPDGRRSIDHIRVGDLVLSRDDKTWSDAAQPVGELYGRNAPDIWELTTEKESFRLTDNHPVWVQGAGWTEAKNVAVGQLLASASGDTMVLSNRQVGSGVQVFNFSVDNTPTYFVGEQGLWVHNQSKRGCLLPIPGKKDEFIKTDSDGKASSLNTPEADTRYVVNGGEQIYITDSSGRTVEAYTTIDQNTVRLARDRCAQLGAGHACGVVGQDDGGHLIGHQLGGVGENVNLVGQLRGANRGEYRVLEGELRELADQGNVIQMTVRPQYSGTNTRPDFIAVEYTVNGGPLVTPPPFDNRP